MPLYEIEYICNLSDEQQDKLAQSVTEIHSEKFKVPRLFVNVKFNSATANAYVAGKRKMSNQLFGHLRTGESRVTADFDEIAAQIIKAWEAIVGTKGVQKLGAVFILGGILSASESGILIPPVGEELAFIKQNFSKFQALAKDGDETFQDLVEEVQNRGLLDLEPATS